MVIGVTEPDSPGEGAGTNSVVLFGGGTQGASLASTFILARQRDGSYPAIVGFYDDAAEHDPGLEMLGIPYLGPIAHGAIRPDVCGVVTVGNGATRLRLAGSVDRVTGGPAPAFIHHMVHIGHFVEIGRGSVVLGNSWIATRTVLGSHVIILAGVTVGHGVTIGDGSSIAPQTSISGEVSLGTIRRLVDI